MVQNSDKTPLAEQPARTLAHWWGGEYEQSSGPETARDLCHGVAFLARQNPLLADNLVRVFSREEAQEVESRRGFQEACSPDWVG